MRESTARVRGPSRCNGCPRATRSAFPNDYNNAPTIGKKLTPDEIVALTIRVSFLKRENRIVAR